MEEENIRERKLWGEAKLENENALELKEPIRLKYYKIKNYNHFSEEGCSYGIEVRKEQQEQEKVLEENAEISSIYRSEKRAEEVLEILRRNKVTPVELKDVISDLNYHYE